eukprot:SAG31_NODE_240_length_19407_cov_29.686140_3_plen_85_part_00
MSLHSEPAAMQMTSPAADPKRLLRLLGATILVAAVEDEGLTVEDVTTSDEAENAKVPPRPKASDSEFRSKLFEVRRAELSHPQS